MYQVANFDFYVCFGHSRLVRDGVQLYAGCVGGCGGRGCLPINCRPPRSCWLFAESSYVSLTAAVVAHEQALCIVGVSLGISGGMGASPVTWSATSICIRGGSSVALVAFSARVPGLSPVVLGGLGLVALKACYFVVPRLPRVQLLLLVGHLCFHHFHQFHQ